MKIALINENSQAAKNAVIFNALKKVADAHGFEVVNYGMYSAESPSLTYVQNGILAATLLNSGACDYVITGCGTGEGAMLALNSFPGVICGHVATPLDAYTFAQINDGNAISIPFALGFGWGGDLNLEYIFEKGLLCRRILERKIMTESLLVKLLFKVGVVKEGLYLRAENKAFPHKGIVKRLYSEHIPRAEEGTVAPVENYKGEHSAKHRH